MLLRNMGVSASCRHANTGGRICKFPFNPDNEAAGSDAWRKRGDSFITESGEAKS